MLGFGVVFLSFFFFMFVGFFLKRKLNLNEIYYLMGPVFV